MKKFLIVYLTIPLVYSACATPAPQNPAAQNMAECRLLCKNGKVQAYRDDDLVCECSALSKGLK